MSRTPRHVWDALDAARRQARDERQAALTAEHDDDIGDELAERNDEWCPPDFYDGDGHDAA